MRRSTVLVAAMVGIALLVGLIWAWSGSGYRLKVVMPSAAQLLDGSPVWTNGEKVGVVSGIVTQDGQAIVTIDVDDRYAPLHTGTTTRVEWKSVLGERVVTLLPGPARNPIIPSGALYTADSSQVEADQVLAALDGPTRQKLASLVTDLNTTVKGREPDIRETLRSAGPTVRALGEVLAAVGRDGPSIRQLVTEMHQMAGGLAARQQQVSATVDHLTGFVGNLAPRQQQLADGLRELPPTLDSAKTTLDKLPAVTEATTPLLEDLRPATSRLPSVAENLRPVLHDLGPVLEDLRPTLRATAGVLRFAPELIDSTHHTLPKLETTFDRMGKPVDFLRPYTPELVGWLHTWGQDFASYDSQGHMWSVGLAQAGPATVNDLPGAVPPVGVDQHPAPGSAVGQPWTDANGDGIR